MVKWSTKWLRLTSEESRKDMSRWNDYSSRWVGTVEHDTLQANQFSANIQNCANLAETVDTWLRLCGHAALKQAKPKLKARQGGRHVFYQLLRNENAAGDARPTGPAPCHFPSSQEKAPAQVHLHRSAI